MSTHSNTRFGDADSELAPSQSKSRRKRKSTAGVRKIQHVWTDDEINRLIVSVKRHRGLWDFTSPAYKLSKLDGWRAVANELEVNGVDAKEAKIKWSSLRTTYMVNLAKMGGQKSGQGPKKNPNTVSWKFFKAMMFLKNNNIQKPTLQIESDAIRGSIVEESSVPFPKLASQFASANQRKRSRSRTPSPSPSSTAGSSNSHKIPNLSRAVAASYSSDTNSTFCNNLLAELRTLSESQARTLRYKIARLMMDFIEANSS